MSHVHHIRFDDPDYAAKSVALLGLVFRVWPPNDAANVDKAAIIDNARQRRSHHFVVYRQDVPLAIATLFVREIITSRGPLPVGALAGVCTHPDHRGQGLGRDVVRAAFNYLPELSVDVSLFQTPVPDFYARLGARLVSNRFHNGSDQSDPFIDIYKMIYPAAFDWPSGDIDLNGPGY